MGRLWHYRWQIGMMPFFAISIWLALTQDIGGTSHAAKTEFVIISVLYVIADVLIVNYFVSTHETTRALSQIAAMTLFTSIFLYTYTAHGEAQYVLAQPLYWVAGWKLLTRNHRAWYPSMLNERLLTSYALATMLLVAGANIRAVDFAAGIHLLQLAGLSLFGVFLGIKEEIEDTERARLWRWIGTGGVGLYTLACLADAVHKYVGAGAIIATPLVAFFAALPVTIVSLRDNLTSPSDKHP